MKNKPLATLCLCVCLILTGAFAVIAAETAVGECEKLIDGIVAYKGASSDGEGLQRWLDGGLTDGAGTSSDFYVIALRQYKTPLDFNAYADALEDCIGGREEKSATTRLKNALALVACGRADSPLVGEIIDTSVGKQGVMSYIFGLHLYNNGASGTVFTSQDIIDALLSLRLEDGGWAITGEYSDPDVTAMALQALAPRYGIDAAVTEAVDGALETLSRKQLEDGGFMSYGAENPESSAQVITALSSLGISIDDARFVKNGNSPLDALVSFALEGGGFCHGTSDEVNETATAQAFYSLVALWRYENGPGSLYVFDDAAASVGDGTVDMDTTESAVTETTEAIETTEKTHPTDETDAFSDENAASPDGGETARSGEKYGYKLWACYIIVGAAAVVCVVLWLCGKRSGKNFIAILLCGVAAAAFVCLTDFSSAGEYYSGASDKTDAVGTVTLSISCEKIAGLSDIDLIPKDGVILPATEFCICDDDTVFTVLTEAAKEYGIQLDNSGAVSNSGGQVYIKGIGYVYEFDFGELSGWIYRVNGKTPSVGCGSYGLHDGDIIEWVYSLELGNDLD